MTEPTPMPPQNRVRTAKLISALEILESLESLLRDGSGEARLAGIRLARSLQQPHPGEAPSPEVERAAGRLETALARNKPAKPPLHALMAQLQRALGSLHNGVETILIVEDEPGMQEVIGETLSSTRWRTEFASTLAEAERRLGGEDVSLVILDLTLPDGDGRDLLTWMRLDHRLATTPVVVTSGAVGSLPPTESLALGADAFVGKPFDPALLKATTARLLSRQAENQRESRIDPLTGLPNRAALADEFTRAQAVARRRKEPLSLALLDLDEFKAINDTHGHPMGDEVLCRFAQQMTQVLRTSDFLARWGGDEFVVLFPDAQPEQALAALERCLVLIGREPYMTADDIPLPAYFSAGVSLVEEGMSVAQALKAADKKLYKTKTTKHRRSEVGLGSE